MNWCLSCGARSRRALCRRCLDGLGRAPPRRLGSGVEVSSALVHNGAARRLVLRLKYQGCRDSAAMLAAVMAPLLPPGAVALVPIPRIRLRRLKYRSDPALLLAEALSRRGGLPVLRVLGPRLWGGSNAGRDRSSRRVRFLRLGTPPEGVVLVDDVITTGMTLETAASTLGNGRVRAAVTATASAWVGQPGRL